MYTSVLQTFFFFLSSTVTLVLTQSPSSSTGPTPGYPSNVPSTVSNTSLSFGTHYAVLNLDLVNALVGSINTTAAGKSFINNTATWINTVHQQTPPPISIFTRIYFSNDKRPEVGPTWPFEEATAALGNDTWSSPVGQLYSAFKPLKGWDVVLPKFGYYAGTGNSLEQILSAQKIDTVILSGLRTSGVILGTTYRLGDLGYQVYVISNNTIETPSTAPADATSIYTAILEGIIPNIPANVITIEQAIAALGRSGPAVY